nr:class I SAM-dependent methyltransferase [Haloprofundus marisrubri]
MTENADRKRDNARSFGDAASAYFDSDAHRAGDDLATLAEWCTDATRVLDVATGAGHTAGAVAAASAGDVVATDLTPEMVATATREFDLPGVVADAERLPFADDSFDAVTCRIAAHHFPDPEAFVSEVARVLEPGGPSLSKTTSFPKTTTSRRFSTISNVCATRHTSRSPPNRSGATGSRQRESKSTPRND